MGRRPWGDKKPSTDDAYALDVRQLARRGGLADGEHTFAWASVWDAFRHGPAAIAYTVAGDALTLRFRYRPSPWEEGWDVRQEVALARTPCHFGGTRPWFACPACGRRVAVLYLVGGAFRCRHCHGLVHASTRGDAAFRTLRKANRLRRRLEGAPALGVIPPRPEWMSFREYWRTVRRIVALDEAYAGAVLPKVEGLAKLLED